MTHVTDPLDDALRRALPAALHPHIAGLAVLLADVLAGTLSSQQAEQRLAADPASATSLAALADQTLDSSIAVQRVDAAPDESTPLPNTATIRIIATSGGDYAEGAIDKRSGTFVDLRLYGGEPPDVRHQRAAQAQRLVVDEILVQITNLDARLGLLATLTATDPTEQRLAALRQTIAPATAPATTAAFRQVIATEQLANVRQALNGRPLATRPSPTLLALLPEIGATDLSFFFDQLAQAADSAESLLTVVGKVSTRSASTQDAAFDAQQIDLALRVAYNRTQTAYIAGLRTLQSLDAAEATVQPTLAMLTQLMPRQLVDAAKAMRLLSACATEAAALIAERIVLIDRADSLRDQSLDAYAQIEALLTVNRDDPWYVVVGKARSLRDLGRSADAVAAFGRYADMFAATDPTAVDYARAAQQFTLYAATHGVAGGAYISVIAEDGALYRAGLRVGDIIIGYGDRTIAIPDLVAALQTSVGMTVRVSYLRRTPEGDMTQISAMAASGSLGADVLPI